MNPLLALIRSEPRARAYLAASLVDDVGIAVSAWAGALMMTNLAETQRARASFMLPALGCFLVGCLVAGPLADAAVRDLGRHRYRVVLAGRAIETLLLGYLVLQLATHPPTVARVLPYVMVSAFMKTALRPTRIAFSVDLLEHEQIAPGVDERGAPLRTKTHLLALTSLTSSLSTLAVLAGLLFGGALMRHVQGRAHVLFAFDVVTNVVFVVIVAAFCRPRSQSPEPVAKPASSFFARNFLDGFRFLAARERRPLLALLAGAWIVEVVEEAYDGKMVIKHVLHGADDAVRHAEISWTVFAMLAAAALPFAARRLGFGRLFVLTMLLDGAVLMIAGRTTAVLPFAVAIGVDRGLTTASSALASVAQNSASSAAMRGRLEATYALCVILGDIASEALATVAAERWGIPGMIVRLGALQMLMVLAIAFACGRRLLDFRVEEARALAPATT